MQEKRREVNGSILGEMQLGPVADDNKQMNINKIFCLFQSTDRAVGDPRQDDHALQVPLKPV